MPPQKILSNVGAKVPPQRPLVAESAPFLADFCMALFALIVPPVLARLETIARAAIDPVPAEKGAAYAALFSPLTKPSRQLG